MARITSAETIHNISVIASDDGNVSLSLSGDHMSMDGNLEVAAYHHGVADVHFSGPLFMYGGNLSVAAEGFSVSQDNTKETLEDSYSSDDLWAHTNFNLSLGNGSYINNINVSQSYKGNVDVSLSGDYAIIGNINVTAHNDESYGWGGGYATLDLGDGNVHVGGDITVTANSNENALLTGSDIIFSPTYSPGALALSPGSIIVTAYSGESQVNLAGTFEVDNLGVLSDQGGTANLDLIGTTHVYGAIGVLAYDNASAHLFANLSGSDLHNIIVSAEHSAEISVDLSGDFHADHLMVRAKGYLDYYSLSSYVPTIHLSGDDASTFNLHNLTLSSDISHVNVILDGNLEIDGNINVSAIGAYYYDGGLVPVYSSSTLEGGGSVDFVNAEGSSLHDISVTSQTYGDSRAYLWGNITVDGSIAIRAGGYSSAADSSISVLSLEHATLNHANLTMFDLGSNTNTVFNFQSLQGTIDDLNLVAQYGGSVSLDMSPAENHILISGDILAVAHGNATLHLSADINGSTLGNISVVANGNSVSHVNLLGSITVDGTISINADYGSSAFLSLQSVDFQNTDLYMQNAYFSYSASTGNINHFLDIVFGSYSLSDEAYTRYGYFPTQINGDIYLTTHYESRLALTLLDVNSLGSDINLLSYQHSSICADIQSLSGNVDHLNVLAGSYEGYSGDNAHVYSSEVQLSINSMSANIDNITMDSSIYYGSSSEFSSVFSVDIQGKVNMNQAGNIFINPGSGDDFLSLNLDEVNANISLINIGNEGASVNYSFASLEMNAVYGHIGSVLIGNDGYTGLIARMMIGNDSNRLGLISDVTLNEVSLYDNGSLNLYASDHNAIYVSVDTFNVFEGALNLQSFGSDSIVSLNIASIDASGGSILLSTNFGSVNQTINFNIGNITFNSSDLTIKALGHNSNINFAPLSMSGSIHDLILETSSGNDLTLNIGSVSIDGNLEVKGADGGTTFLSNSTSTAALYNLQSLSLTGEGGNAQVIFDSNTHINIHDSLTFSNQSSDSYVGLVAGGINFDDANLIIEDVGASNSLYLNAPLSGNIHDLTLNFSADTTFLLDLGHSIDIAHSISVTGQSRDDISLQGNIDGSSFHELTSTAQASSNVSISLSGDITLGSGSIDATHDGLFITANSSSRSLTTLGNITFNYADLSLHAEGAHIRGDNELKWDSISGNIDNLTLVAGSFGGVSLDLTSYVVSIHDTISIEAAYSSDVHLTANIDINSFNAIDINTSNNGYVDVNLAGDITLGSGNIEATHDGLFITSYNTHYSNDSGNITLGNISFDHADLSVRYTGNSIELHGLNHISGTIDNLTLYADSANFHLGMSPTDTATIDGTISIEAHNKGRVGSWGNIHDSTLNNIHVSADSSGYVSVDLSGDITAQDIHISTDSEGFASVEISQVTLSGNIELYSSYSSGGAVSASGDWTTSSLDIQSLSGSLDHIHVSAEYGGYSTLTINGNITVNDIVLSADSHSINFSSEVDLRGNIDGSTVGHLSLDATDGGVVNARLSGEIAVTDTLKLTASGHPTDFQSSAYLSAEVTGNIGTISVSSDFGGSAIANLSLSTITVTDLMRVSADHSTTSLSLDHVTFANADLILFNHSGDFHINYNSISGTIDNLTLNTQNGGNISFNSGNVDISGNVSLYSSGPSSQSILSSDHASVDLQSIRLTASLQGTSSANFNSRDILVSNDVLLSSHGSGAMAQLDLGSLTFNSAALAISVGDFGDVMFGSPFIASGNIESLSAHSGLGSTINLDIGGSVDIVGDITVEANGGSTYLYSQSADMALNGGSLYDSTYEHSGVRDMTLQSISVISSGGMAIVDLSAVDVTVTEGILISSGSTDTTASLLLGNVSFDSANLTIQDFNGAHDLSFITGALSGSIDNFKLATKHGGTDGIVLGDNVDILGNITVTSAFDNSSSTLTADLGVANVNFIDLEAVQSSESNISLLGSVTVHGGVLLSADAFSVAHLSIEHLRFDYASLTINEAGLTMDTHTASFNIGSVSGTIDGLFLRAYDGAREGYNLSAIFTSDTSHVHISGDIGVLSSGDGSDLQIYSFDTSVGSHFDNITATASDYGRVSLNVNVYNLTIDGNLEIASTYNGNVDLVDFVQPITMAGGDLRVIADGWNSNDISGKESTDLIAYNHFSVSLDSTSEINNLNVSQRYGGEASLQLAGDFSVKNINVSTDSSTTSSVDVGGGFASLDLGTGNVDVSGNINVSAQFNQHANLTGNIDGSHVEDIFIGNYGGSVDVNLSGPFDVSGNILLWADYGRASLDLSVNGSSLHNISVIADVSGDASLNLSGAIKVTDNINVVADPFIFYPAFGEAHSSLTGSVGGSMFHNMSVISAFNGSAEVNLSGNVTLNGTLSVKALDTAIPLPGLFFSGDTNASDLIGQVDFSSDPTFSPSTYVAFDHINFDGANLVIDEAGSSADLNLIIHDASGTLDNLDVKAESGAHLSYYLPDNVSMSGDLTVRAVADNQYVCKDIYFTSVSFDASLANSFMHSIDIEASNLSNDIGVYQGAFVSAHILGSINLQKINVSASAEDRASLILDHVSGPIDQVHLSVGEAYPGGLYGSADVNFAAHFDSAGYIHNLYINSANHFFFDDSNNVTVDISQSTFGGNVFISSELLSTPYENVDNHINLTYHGATASFVSIDQNYKGGFNLTIDIGDQNYVNANDILKTSLTIDGLDHVSSNLSLNHLSGEMYINPSNEINFNSMFTDAKYQIDNKGMNFYFAQLSGDSKDGYLFYDTDHKGITQMIELINVNESMMTAYSHDFARQFGATDFTVV